MSARPDAAIVVELDRFEGPLDLLLHLIREQDIDIFDIPIARITQQFLEAIEGIEELGLDNAADFLEMAATLVRIKAQMLLPRPSLDAPGEDPRYELVRRLLEYEHFREVARSLDEAEAERRRHFARGYVPPRPAPDPAELEVDAGPEDLLDAVAGLAQRAELLREHRVLRRPVPVERKARLILEALGRLHRVEFRHLVAPFGDRMHDVMTLVAGLELARRRRVSVRQRRPFAPLWFFPGREGTAMSVEEAAAEVAGALARAEVAGALAGVEAAGAEMGGPPAPVEVPGSSGTAGVAGTGGGDGGGGEPDRESATGAGDGDEADR